MNISQELLDQLTAQAKCSPRGRSHFDLRNSPEDNSQCMLIAIEPVSLTAPIHRHDTSSETVAVLRGHFRELMYDNDVFFRSG